MREGYQIALILILALAAFLPGLQAGYFIFDDFHIVEHLQLRGFDAIQLFPSEGSRYLRPLIMLSFLADIHLWNAHPGIMHLENLLLHAANAALVFAIVKSMLPGYPARDKWLPLLAAVLFLLHPTTAESVNWIAGRSDPLAALFALQGFWLLTRAISTGRTVFSLGAATVMFAGCLVKEVAVFVLPGAILILLLSRDRSLKKPELTWRMANSLPFVVAGLLYTAIRTRTFSTLDHSTSQLLGELPTTTGSWVGQLSKALTAMGFYAKKLFLPYPLNFAIDHVSPLYFWLGLLTVPVIIVLLCRRDLRAGAVLVAVLCIVPPLLNVLYEFAWTIYAERYLYLPAAFFSIALFSGSPVRLPTAYIRNTLVALLLLTFLPLTFHRNLQWGDPLVILEDATQQAPGNLDLQTNYAIVLTDHSGAAAGRREFEKVLVVDPDHEEARTNLAKIALLFMDDPLLARRDLDDYFTGRKKPTAKISKLMEEIRAECAAKSLDCN